MKKNLLIQEPPLQVLPSLAKAIGLNEAIVLQQVHYWLENPKTGVDRDGFKWVFNTYEGWTENFPFWSASTIQRIFASLEKQNLIISAQLEKSNWDKTKFYRIDYSQLATIEHVNLTSSNVSTCDDLNRNTETTAETTTPRREKKGDLLDGMLAYARSPQAVEEDEVEKLIQEIEAGLFVNVDRSVRNQQIAKRILKEGKNGRPFAEWLSWCKSEPWRLEHTYLYRDLSRIWGEYRQAFKSESEKAQVSPDGVNRGKYV